MTEPSQYPANSCVRLFTSLRKTLPTATLTSPQDHYLQFSSIDFRGRVRQYARAWRIISHYRGERVIHEDKILFEYCDGSAARVRRFRYSGARGVGTIDGSDAKRFDGHDQEEKEEEAGRGFHGYDSDVGQRFDCCEEDDQEEGRYG